MSRKVNLNTKEVEIKNSEDQLVAVSVENETDVKQVKKEKEFFVFQLVGSFSKIHPEDLPFPKYMSIPNEDYIIDENGKERAIRYLEGVDTIFVDEQNDVPEHIASRRPDISFRDGILRISKHKRTFAKFMMDSNRYDGKENRIGGRPPIYTLLNHEVVAEGRLKASMNKSEAMNLAKVTDIPTMVAHAKYLNIQFINTLGDVKSNEELRADYMEVAEAKPLEFLRSFNDPSMRVKYKVSQAFAEGVISAGIITGSVCWTKDNSVITKIPSGANAITHITNYCMTSDGKDLWEKIK